MIKSLDDLELSRTTGEFVRRDLRQLSSFVDLNYSDSDYDVYVILQQMIFIISIIIKDAEFHSQDTITLRVLRSADLDACLALFRRGARSAPIRL